MTDLMLAVGGGTDVFVVFWPAPGTMAGEFKKSSAGLRYEDCFSAQGHYWSGSFPVGESGTHYCWKTNEGRLVTFIVEKIELIEYIYRVQIRYVVWEEVEGFKPESGSARLRLRSQIRNTWSPAKISLPKSSTNRYPFRIYFPE